MVSHPNSRVKVQRPRGPFLETPDNFPGPKIVLSAQYCPTGVQSLLILKAKF